MTQRPHMQEGVAPEVGRILLAEDNDVRAEATLELLAHAGYDCDVVEHGRAAVQAVLDGDYDLVLMNCLLPEMDGFDATRAIRRNEEDGKVLRGAKGRIPIIALTANAVEGDRERCLDAGMDDYLTKPLDPQRLAEVVEHHLARATEVPFAPSDGVPESLEAEAHTVEDGVNQGTVDASPPFDLDAMHKRWGGNKEFAEKLIGKFCSDAPTEFEELKQSVAEENADEATHFAHRLKGAAAYVSAEAVRVLALRLEEMGRAGDLSGADELLGKLRIELQRCLEYGPNPTDAPELAPAECDR